MERIFVGGRGFGLRLLWNAVTQRTRWNDPENEIIISSGPIGGTTSYPGAGKSTVVSLSPATHSVIDSNAGGHFGPFLKFSGWDAIEVQGKARNEVFIRIDGVKGIIAIEEASQEETNTHVLVARLMDLYCENEEDGRNISIVSSGIGAQHTVFGCLNFSFYDQARKTVRIKQAGRGGIGTTFRDKRIHQ
jgi:aldehyde:ferredoxin oxidoreductase